MTCHIYVSKGGADELTRVRMDTRSGKLEPQEYIGLDSPVGPLALDGDERFLFVSLRQNRRLASFRIDTDTGQLAPINSVRLTDRKFDSA